ncbi:IQ domain-containing protein M [Ctenodactylus gundi]
MVEALGGVIADELLTAWQMQSQVREKWRNQRPSVQVKPQPSAPSSHTTPSNSTRHPEWLSVCNETNQTFELKEAFCEVGSTSTEKGRSTLDSQPVLTVLSYENFFCNEYSYGHDRGQSDKGLECSQVKQAEEHTAAGAPVKLSKIMSDIEGVSKKMEKEKEQRARKARLSESLYAFPSPARVPLRHITSSTGQQKEPDLFAFLNFGYITCNSPGKYEIARKERDSRKKILSKPDKLDRKVKRIGPHIEIFQVFRERHKLIITKKVIRLVTVMQAFVRGWLERRRLQRLMVKALSHGPSLRAVIDMYRALIHRVRYRLGLWRTRQIINFEELEEWMDRKKFYETMFAKREIWQGIERSELLKYFNECGHYPTEKQVDDYWGLVFRDKKEIFLELIKKSHAIELLFTLYPPHGAHVLNNTRLRSTWLRPIVNGEEGYKYIATGHPILKRANIQIVGKLVAQSIRERKMRQFCKL